MIKSLRRFPPMDWRRSFPLLLLGQLMLAQPSDLSHAHGHGGPAPAVKDELSQFGIYETTAPHPKKIAPVETTLALELRRGDRVVFIGNTLFERAAHACLVRRRAGTHAASG